MSFCIRPHFITSFFLKDSDVNRSHPIQDRQKMLRKTLFLFSATCLVACSQQTLTSATPEPSAPLPIAEAAPEVPFSCPHNESREISFTSAQAKDKLLIDIIGDDCNAARIKMQIITQKGQVVHSSEARALDYAYDAEGPTGVKYMLESLVTTQSQLNALMGRDYDMTGQHSGYYDVNLKAVMHHKTQNAPLFCHRAGKSFSRCFVYLDEKAVIAFTSGS